MTKIIYDGYVFEDASNDIIDASGALHQSLISTELSADDFTFTARYNPSVLGYYILDPEHGSDFLRTKFGEIVTVRSAADEIPFEDFEYATPAYLYEDDELIYKFFVTNIAPIQMEQDGTIQFRFTCVSMVGLLINQEHKGGMYSNAKFREIVAEILKGTKVDEEDFIEYYETATGLTYSIDSNVANFRFDGRLKKQSARDNLQEVLTVCGASVLKNADGSIRFTFNQPDTPIGIDADYVYMGDSYGNAQKVTDVYVTEHSFYQLPDTEESTLYDSGQEYADHSEIVFDEPYYGLRSDTLTIHESNCNYAIVSGIGILYGKEYTHVRHRVGLATGLSGETNEKAVDEVELVSPLNSVNILERLSNYYANAKEVNYDFVVRDNVRTGSLVSFLDLLNRQKTGYVSEMQFVISGIVKSVSKIITNWTPTAIGQGYTISETLTGDGTYTIPAGTSRIRLVLIQGGKGGWGGYKGGNGEGHRSDWSPAEDVQGSKGGDGGNVGEGGNGGKVLSIDIDVQPAETFEYHTGVGGQGGAINHGEGAEGTHSTFGEYSSEDGGAPASGFLNIITNILYATKGPNGYVKGGRGQDVDTNNGENVSYGGQTWQGGDEGNSARWDGRYVVSGGGGSGAAYGANGINGGNGSTYYPNSRAGDGAVGANAQFISYVPIYGQGGVGGNGGGGGGVGGIILGSATGLTTRVGNGGSGGNGSKGGNGGDGVIFVIR